MVYNDGEVETRSELRELQDERLRETVTRVYENVPFYRGRLDEAGVSPSDVETVEDLPKLPFTTKEDLRDQYPDGLFAVEDDDIRRIHASSGTTGKPKVVCYTENDLDVWGEVMARSLAAAGVEPGQTMQNAYGYGLFTGGLGFHDGGEELGVTVIPMGGGGTQRQIEFVQDLESDVLACTPSYCLYFAEQAEAQGLDPREFSLETVVIGAEPFTDEMRNEIEAALDVNAIDIYGLSELIGPGVSVECVEAQDGLHVWEDHFYPEVIDPDTGDPVEPGEEGELVLTSLTREGIPMLRYRTGDMTRLVEEPCACGRIHRRMDNVTGRSDDLIIVRGVNVYPSQIEEVVLEFDEVAPYYRIDLDREGSLDTIEVTVELKDEGADAEDVGARIEKRLQNVLSLSPNALHVVEPGGIERTEVGKIQRVFDHRD